MRHHYGANKGGPQKSMDISALWIRKEGDSVVMLFERDGKWHEACREKLDGQFSHIVEYSGMLSAGLDTLV
jgi:hypothetical protein